MTTPQAVYKIYKSVIDDVIGNVREAFIDEGVDEQVLQDLRQMWENKLLQTEAVDPNAPETQPQSKSSSSSRAEQRAQQQAEQRQAAAAKGPLPKVPIYDRKFTATTQGGQFTGSLSSPAAAATLALQQQVRQQVLQIPGGTFTLPQGGQTFQVQGVQGGAVGYQVPLVIQQQLGGQQIMTVPQARATGPNTGQKILQLDGANDGSSDDDDDSDDAENNEDDDDDDEQDENDEYSNAVEEEPLNTDDDVSDEDPSEMFEADNVVVCQYDKISRTRNKWKFQLKQGIMNLKGKDNIFFKAQGEADW